MKRRLNSPFLRLISQCKDQLVIKINPNIDWLHKDVSTHINGWAILGQTYDGYTILRNVTGDGSVIEMSLN